MKTSTPNITLRPIETSDEEFLLRVYASTRDEELSVAPWTDEQKIAFLRSQFDAQSRHYRENYPGAAFGVILADEARVGRLYVARWDDEIRIMDIALLPEHRGSGLGTRLLEDLIRESERSGKALTIHVERFNPAMRLYSRRGFRMKEDKGVYILMERPPEGTAE